MLYRITPIVELKSLSNAPLWGQWLRRRCGDRPASHSQHNEGGSVISWQNWWLMMELKDQSGGWPKKKKRECTSYIDPTKNEAFQGDKFDKGHAFNVGNCVMRAKTRGESITRAATFLMLMRAQCECCVTPCHAHVLCTWIWLFE